VLRVLAFRVVLVVGATVNSTQSLVKARADVPLTFPVMSCGVTDDAVKPVPDSPTKFNVAAFAIDAIPDAPNKTLATAAEQIRRFMAQHSYLSANL
jgi:hypothetical protein